MHKKLSKNLFAESQQNNFEKRKKKLKNSKVKQKHFIVIHRKRTQVKLPCNSVSTCVNLSKAEAQKSGQWPCSPLSPRFPEKHCKSLKKYK